MIPPSAQPTAHGFIIDKVPFSRTCAYIAAYPGIMFTDRRRFFWWSDSIKAEFSLDGCTYIVVPGDWDDYVTIEPKHGLSCSDEIHKLCEHMAQCVSQYRSVCFRMKSWFTTVLTSR